MSTLGLTLPILNTFPFGYSRPENKYDITFDRYNVQSNFLDKYCILLSVLQRSRKDFFKFSVSTCNTIERSNKDSYSCFTEMEMAIFNIKRDVFSSSRNETLDNFVALRFKSKRKIHLSNPTYTIVVHEF